MTAADTARGAWVTATCAERDAAIAAAGGRDALEVWAWDTDDRTYSHSELRAGDRPVVADHRTVEQGCWHQVWSTAELTDAEVDTARRRGPHRLGCPALDEDPDGIEQCECEPAQVTR